MTKRLEIWADSFHEGRWVAEELSRRLSNSPVQYDKGYLPVFELSYGHLSLRVKVYGDYQAWTPKPAAIASVLQYGKPDFMLYAADEERVLFIGEETAAVPTGNQSTQRCERVIGACLQSPPVPFVYLLPEYGLHIDGQPRRTSVWPPMLAAKLADQYRTTSLVLMFGDREHLEDYSIGRGPTLVFDLLATYVKEYMGVPEAQWQVERDRIVEEAKAIMLAFVRDQAPSMLKVLPSYCLGGDSIDWPLPSEITDDVPFAVSPLLRADPFLSCVYEVVDRRGAYTLVRGSGSKPQSQESLEAYKAEHVAAVNAHAYRPADYPGYTPDISTFPRSKNGNCHLTSSMDITFLFERGRDLIACYRTAFARPAGVIERLRALIDDEPIFLYTTASMKKGRVFGDPYSGQFACFAKVLAYDHSNRKTRKVVGYFPLQSFAAFPDRPGRWGRSKGLRLYQEFVDIIICHGGVVVLPATKEIL